jgi:hypothetical protein
MTSRQNMVVTPSLWQTDHDVLLTMTMWMVTLWRQQSPQHRQKVCADLQALYQRECFELRPVYLPSVTAKLKK